MRVRGYAEGVPCWAELGTADPLAAAAFYGALFGWAYDPAGGVLRIHGLAVAGLVAAEAYPAGWLTYLNVADLGPVLDLAVDAGAAVVRAPGEVPGYGRGAVVSDPAGARFGLWERGTLAGAQLGSQPGTFCSSELVTADVSGSVAFYGKLFGWSAASGEMAPGFAYRDWLLGDRVVGGLVEAARGEAAHWCGTVEVVDLDDVLERCTARYGQVAVKPVDVAVGRYARLADPHGGVIGVIELIPELRDLVN